MEREICRRLCWREIMDVGSEDLQTEQYCVIPSMLQPSRQVYSQ